MTIDVHWIGKTHVGCLRRRNEDSWAAEKLSGASPAWLLTVADGMGGHPGGDVASRLAVDSLIDEAALCNQDESPVRILDRLFRRSHQALRERAARERRLLEMGTTMTALLLRGDGGWVGHVGDSRLLWFRNGEIALVTRDHSVAWDLVLGGSLRPEHAETDPSGAILTRYLGPESNYAPDLLPEPMRLEAEDRLLLSTDGLGKVVTMEEIARVLTDEPVEQAVHTLMAASLDRGAPDNVTMVLAEVREAPNLSSAGLAWETLQYRWKGRETE